MKTKKTFLEFFYTKLMGY